MTLITILEIVSNYPDNILIEAVKHKTKKAYGSVMYLTKDGKIHKVMLSYDDFPFDSKKEAIMMMKKNIAIAEKYYKTIYCQNK